MNPLLQDVRQAVRSLRNSPGFVAVAVVTLALGIGANTAVFSLVSAVLFHPVPVDGLDRLAVIREDLPDLNLLQAQLAPAEVMDLAERREALEAVTGFRAGDRTLTGFGDPARVGVVATLGDFRGVFGVRPALGRFYGPEASTDGTHRVAVVSHGLWQRLSGGDPAFLGTVLSLNGEPYEVVGVLPAAFRYPRDAGVWVPFEYTERWSSPDLRGSLFMTTVARTRPGVGAARLDGVLEAEAAEWNEQYHAGGMGKVLSATPFVEYLAGPLRLILLVLLGAVVLVLLIAAANVASLQLVRYVAREREIAVRSAMGAGARRILRQFAAESVILWALSTAGGLWLGALVLAVLERWGPAAAMQLGGVGLDPFVLVATALAALVAVAASAGLPAVRASRTSPQRVLRDGARGATGGVRRHRLLKGAVVAQIGLSLVLLLSSGLVLRTLSRLLAADPGFDADGLVTAQVSIPRSRYDDADKTLGFFDALLDRARSVPGVDAAALVWGLPFTGQNDSSPFDIPGQPRRPGEPERHAEARIVSPGYFATMGIPLIGGRDFDGTERPGSPLVAVIDETFARQFFPGEDPVGRRIRSYFGDEATIIGVAGRVDHDEIGDAPKAVAYYSYRHQYWMGWRSIVVRSARPVGDVAGALRSIVHDLDPAVPVYDVQTMDGRIERSLGPRRLAMVALGGFALLSLLLAALGVYGVMRYITRWRTHEIGIRIALGARPRTVLALMAWQGAVVTAAGVALGSAAALSATGLMRGILFGVGPQDPLTFVAAILVLSVVAMAASLIPARRAVRVDPVEALRVE